MTGQWIHTKSTLSCQLNAGNGTLSASHKLHTELSWSRSTAQWLSLFSFLPSWNGFAYGWKLHEWSIPLPQMLFQVLLLSLVAFVTSCIYLLPLTFVIILCLMVWMLQLNFLFCFRPSCWLPQIVQFWMILNMTPLTCYGRKYAKEMGCRVIKCMYVQLPWVLETVLQNDCTPVEISINSMRIPVHPRPCTIWHILVFIYLAMLVGV